MAVQIANSKPLLRNGRAVNLAPGDDSGEPEQPVLTTLTLAESHLDFTVYQRRTDNTARVPVAGTFQGEIPTVVQARTVNDATGAQSLAWINLTDLSIGAGTFAGYLVVPKSARIDMHRLQARAGATQPVANSTRRFTVGIRMAYSGQSNMVNLPDGVSRYPSGARGCYEYRGGSNKRIGNISDTFPPNTLFGGAGGYGDYTTQGKNGDGYVYIANQVAMLTDTPVCVYERSSGGTPISGWTGPTPAAWNDFVAGLPVGHGDFEIFLWYQGESNAHDTSTAAMVAELSKLHTKVLALTSRTASTLSFGIVSLGAGSYSGSTEGEFGNMRAAHVQYANSTAGAFLAACAHDSATSDGVHLVGASHAQNGARAGLSIAARLGIGQPGTGPRVVSATRSGLTVTVTVQHTGGALLRDGAGGTGSALRGFVFTDSSGPVAYSSSSIVSATAMQFMLSKTPTGSLTVSYGMMDNPHNTDPTNSRTAIVAASVPCDNAMVLGSPYGCPLQPFAPINITGS